MNLHEHQAKSLFKDFALPVPNGAVIYHKADIKKSIAQLSGSKWAIKAQVHAGGRGKAGGVAIISSVKEAQDFADRLLGTNLVTYQTDKEGQLVSSLLVEEVCNIATEFYLSILVDRDSNKIAIIASSEGGMDIEEVLKTSPEKIVTVYINPVTGIMSYQVRELFNTLGLTSKELFGSFGKMIINMLDMFKQKDLSMLEINPLVLTKEGNLLCLDAKLSIDDSAFYRQKELFSIRDTSQEDEKEIYAQSLDLNYVSLEGDIGCMVNGAGLAMATMDLIKLHGGAPANFLDVGGSADAQRVTQALEIILSDKNVKSVLINIFGGIVRCDLIADGIIDALGKMDTDVNFIIRLEGNNAELGLEKIANTNLKVNVEKDLAKATKLAIALTKQA